MRSLPVPESVLKRHCEAVAPIFAKKKMQTLQVGADCCCCRTRVLSCAMQQSGALGTYANQPWEHVQASRGHLHVALLLCGPQVSVWVSKP